MNMDSDFRGDKITDSSMGLLVLWAIWVIGLAGLAAWLYLLW